MSFSEWKQMSLGDVCVKITDGAHFSPKDDGNGLPMASVKDLNRFGVEVSSCRKISRKDFDSLVLQGCSPNKGDVLIAKDGNTSLDTVCVYKQDDLIVLLSSVAILRPNENLITADFLNYHLDNPDVRKYLKENFRSGSAIPRVVLRDFRKAPINVPSRDVQDKITSILRALDDKIELNRQMAQTLEAMAQALFKEMCLPKGDELEEGWRVGKLGEFYKTTSGGTPSRGKMEFYENGTINWVKSKELGEFFVLDTEEKITEVALKSSSAKLLPVNSVMLAMYGATVGEISILGEPASSNQAICSILPNDNYPFSFIYELLKSQKENIKHMAVGGAQQNISQAVIQGLEIVMPSPKVLKAFHKLVSPIYDTIKCGINQTRTLTFLRDGLLPKLMKGEIEI